MTHPHGPHCRNTPAWHATEERAERALLDEHIRTLSKESSMAPTMFDPEGEPAPTPQDDDLEQAA
ncbi:hypothetical protein KCMC57_64560 (plasmid) [Kitasatospora sp. CMC57]|uniref:Uncharacterized protein n=1 Tax=Kitasatospora sp. CMC57 TaxID=3231513 RepID=A0AB33KE11_9ACTN